MALSASSLAALFAIVCTTNNASLFVRADECAHTEVVHYDAVEPTCDKAGSIEYWVCCECHNSYSDEALTNLIANTANSNGVVFTEDDGRYLAPTHALGEIKPVVAPTAETEGSAVQECEKCDHTVEYKILKLSSKVTLTGNILAWEAVEGATAYNVFNDDALLHTTTELSYTLPHDVLVDASRQSPEILGVQAITTAEGYFAYGVATIDSDDLAVSENIQPNADFSSVNNVITYEANDNGKWTYYPYGNWNVTPYHFITDETGNSFAKLSCGSWGQAAEFKRDLSAETVQPGTYEISFDVKASETALTATAGDGITTAWCNIYMWNNAGGTDHATAVDGKWILKDHANSEDWTNARLRYNVDAAGTFNQFNIQIWAEGQYVDSYMLIDNIEIYKVVDGVAVETNVDTKGNGDFEGLNTTVMARPGTWYHNGNILLEHESVGSSIVKEGENTALRLWSGNRTSDARITLKGNGAMNTAGMYLVTVNLKLGIDASLDTAIKLTVWSWKDGGVQALCDQITLRPMGGPELNTETYATYGGVLVSKGFANDWANLFIVADLGNDVNPSADNCIYIDNLTVSTLNFA